jgi:Predicted nucleic acid-binding protein, contains PIN domain
MVVFLDTGPLGMVSNPKSSQENDACQIWLTELVQQGLRVVVPEIADYEVRRELLRAGKATGIARLDRVKDALEYLPITTDAMLLAASLWAQARQQGQPTADRKSLDGDVILAAQALTAGFPENEVLIASDNVGHLSRFAQAKHWRDIS